MEFRPCIDIHNGKVKQLVGGSLRDQHSSARENFVAAQDAAFYAGLYREHKISGGHVILLNPAGSEYYEQTRAQAYCALETYPGGLQVGGGITADNASEYLSAGAAQVIVTSYVFRDGRVHYDRLEQLKNRVGREKLVLDLSCRRVDGEYRIVTDRWQKLTDETLTYETLKRLSSYCCEFLIHAVDVEGKSQGIDVRLVRLLGGFSEIPSTYAGGVHSFEDLRLIKEEGQGRVNVTIGSSLDLFGGGMSFTEVLAYIGHTE